MSFQHPVIALMDDVKVILAAAGNTTPHLMGQRSVKTNQRPPYYVWVPTGFTTPAKPSIPTRDIDEDRSLAMLDLAFTVIVRGANYHQVHALSNNLLRAVHLSAFADITPGRGQFVLPSEAYNQDGEQLAWDFTITAPMIDAWVDVTTLDDPTVDTIIPDEIDGSLELAPDVDTSGELALVVVEP